MKIERSSDIFNERNGFRKMSKEDEKMSKIDGYGVYQNSYYSNSVKNSATKGAEKTDKSGKADKTESKVTLSAKAKKLLEELKKNYKNMDFIVADYESDEEAASYLARGTKEYSVLIEPETLEEMAADNEAKEKYTGIIDDAVGQLKDMESQLGDKIDEVAHLGISVGNDGKVSYFADLEKVSERQKDFIEKTRANKKEERTAQAKKAEESAAKGRTKRTRVEADSAQELLEKIKAVDWEQVKAEEKPVTGGRFDFTI